MVARHRCLLAVENHKDWRADELLALLKKVGSDSLGVCLDTGNSISLLEDPMEVVEALAPRAFTTHFKDMAVEEYRDGFLLAEVPLGTGFLDLPRVVRVLREARPEIRFNLEMITRDPLKVPCLTDRYWATFADLPGRTPGPHALARPRPRSEDARCRGSACWGPRNRCAPRMRMSNDASPTRAIGSGCEICRPRPFDESPRRHSTGRHSSRAGQGMGTSLNENGTSTMVCESR